MKHLAMIALGLALLSTMAHAADLCKAVALRNVAAIENPDSILPRGSYDTAITQYNVNKQTGVKSFCSHGGYCYPAEALRLTNCKIGKRVDEDKEEITYSVDVVRSKNAP